MNQSCNKLRYLFIIGILLAAMILVVSSRASAYVLKTIEETGHLNYIDVAVDSDGNLYTFADNNHIVKMDPSGNILYDFGSLYDPILLTVDPSGNVIIISTNEDNDSVGDVVKFAKTSTGYSFAWQKTMCVDVYPGLRELTTDSNGNFYLVFDNSVLKYDPSFNYLTYISSTYSNGYIKAVAVVDNIIYYSDGYNRKIMKIDANGTHTVVKTLPFEGELITLDGSGNIYVTENRESDCYIYKIDAGGNLSFYAGGMENYDMGISGLAADRNGNVYAGYPISYYNSKVVRVIPSPEVSGISTGSGPASGGTAVTVTGTGFSGATEVKFGTNAALSFSVVNDTTITVTAPPGSGAVSLTVTTPARGTSNPSSAQFYYIPVLSAVSPASGPATGGTTVDITGTGFTSVTGVKFGGNAASFTFVSDTRITATAPAGTGVADVTVTTAGGTSQTGPGDRFNYIPVVSGISPAGGPIVGGATVTISGKGLTGATEVKFGSAAATILSVTDTSITATAPPGSGVVDVTVTTPGGTSVTSTAGRFSYLPVVNSISPNYGPLDGGTQVTISGSGFTGASAVNFGANSAVSFTIVNDTQITATAPAGSGWVDVTVTTAGCTSATGTGDRFYYPPAVGSLSLHEGTAQGGTSITITGTGFINVTGVSFGSISAKNYTVNSDTKITATAPKWGGRVHVYVTTVGGTSPATDNDLYTFIPAVSSVSLYEGGQATGPATGGTKVEISGYGIGVIRDDASGQKITITPTAVYFGATPATNVAVDTLYAGFINFNAPPGCGVVDVTVVTAYGTTAVNANAKFKYIPIVSSISTTGGSAAGGTEVSINGAGFTSDSVVKFGATAATNVTYISDKQMKAISPPGSGKVDITVTTPGGTSATGIQFTYGPVVSGVNPSISLPAGGISVTITGSGFTGATAVKFGSADSTSFTITSDTSITAIAPPGTGTVDITVINARGTSATNSSDRFTYDGQGPTVTIGSTVSGITNKSPIPVTITFSEAVTGFDISDITVGNGSKSNFSGSGTTYTVDVTPAAQGTVTISVAAGMAQDAVGNGNAEVVFNYTFDTQGPAVNISSTALSPTNATPIPVTIAFTEAVTGFEAPDLAVTNGTVANFSGSGASYTASITPSGQGPVTVNIAAGVAWDAAENNNSAAAQFSLVYDSAAPAANLSINNGEILTHDSAATLAITASDGIGSGLAQMRFSNDNIAWSNWESYGTTKNWTLGKASSGVATVYLQVRDSAGNTGNASDTINVGVTTNIFVPVVKGDSSGIKPSSPNLLQTAQNFRGNPSVRIDPATLWLGKGTNGSYSDLWLYFPQLIGSGEGQIPAGSKIVSAKLVLTLKETSGNQNQRRGFKLYQITDPDGKGQPYFGASGLFNGLDFKYRDHRPGRNIKWASGAADIMDLFGTAQPVDTYELIPSIFQKEAQNEIRLDVTSSIIDWLSGDSKKANQGWYLTVDQNLNWGYNDGLIFYGAAEALASRRPRLEISLSADGNNARPDPVTVFNVVPGNEHVGLSWTKPNGCAGVVVVRKTGVIPAYPADGTIVYDGSILTNRDDQGLSNGKTYYYAIFAYDNLRNYSRKYYQAAVPFMGSAGTPPAVPSWQTVNLSNNTLTFKWADNSGDEDWFVIEQQKSGDVTMTWKPIAYPGADQTCLSLQCDDPALSLEPNTSYQYRIKAVNAFGSSPDTEYISSIFTPGFPAAPAGLTWAIISAGRVNLSWKDAANNETAYRVDVYRNDAGYTKLKSIDLPAGAEAVSVTGLAPGVEYLFKVVAVNTAGENGVWSDPVVTGSDPKGGLL